MGKKENGAKEERKKKKRRKQRKKKPESRAITKASKDGRKSGSVVLATKFCPRFSATADLGEEK